MIDLKDRHSIARSYFRSLIDPDGYECLVDPVDVFCWEPTASGTILGFKLEVGMSAVVGMVVGYQGSDAQRVIDVVYEACSPTCSSRRVGRLISI